MQVVKAVGLAKKERPDLLIEGPMQVLMVVSKLTIFCALCPKRKHCLLLSVVS